MENKKKKTNVFIKTSDAFTCWDLPDERFAKLMRAVIMYSYDGTTPDELDPELATMFKFFKTTADNYSNEYERTCERNSQNAIKGGGNPNFRKGQPNPYYKRDNQTLTEITEDNREITDITKINEINEINQLDRIGLDRIGEDRMFSNENEEKEIIPPNGVIKEKKPAARFVPPTVEEVAEYVAEKGYTFDPEAFVAFYASKGWKVGNQPMKKWQMACVTWQKKQDERNGRASPPSPPPKEQVKSPIPEYTDEEWNSLPLWEQDAAVHKHYGLD